MIRVACDMDGSSSIPIYSAANKGIVRVWRVRQGRLFFDPSSHEIALFVRVKAHLPIECLASSIRVFHFQVERVDAQVTTLLENELECFCADALVAVSGCEKHFIDHGIPPVKFQAVSKRHCDVPDRLCIAADEPQPSQGRVFDECLQGRASDLFIERILIDGIELLHKAQQQINVSSIRKAEMNLQHGTPL